jgi:hypothetical protein
MVGTLYTQNIHKVVDGADLLIPRQMCPPVLNPCPAASAATPKVKPLGIGAAIKGARRQL